MKLTIFEASGQSGVELVQESLKKGHHVTALVRNPYRLHLKHDNLEVDLSKEDDLFPHIKGRDAFLPCLGANAGIFVPCSLYTDSIRSITAAMRKGGVTRLFVMSSLGTKGKEIVTAGGQYVQAASSTPRLDVAKFMLMCAVTGEWNKRHIAFEIS